MVYTVTHKIQTQDDLKTGKNSLLAANSTEKLTQAVDLAMRIAGNSERDINNNLYRKDANKFRKITIEIEICDD